MAQLIVRALMAVAGVITAWFVSRDAIGFAVYESVVAIILFTLAVALLAFWPQIRPFLGGARKSTTGPQ